MKTFLKSQSLVRNAGIAVITLSLFGGTLARASGLLTTSEDPKPKKKQKRLTDSGSSSKLIAMRESGGAHNGPVTSGVSIPRQTDRAIRLGDLEKTVEACQSGILHEIASQILPDPEYSDSTYYKTAPIWDSTSFGGKTVPTRWTYIEFSRFKASSEKMLQATITSAQVVAPIYSNGTVSEPEAVRNLMSVNLEVRTLGANSEKVYLEIYLPTIDFDDTFRDGTVTELGNNDFSQIAVKNLRITYPAGTPDVVTLVNQRTKKPTQLKLNLRGYYDCLVNGAQK
jgi:hypothetical protein